MAKGGLNHIHTRIQGHQLSMQVFEICWLAQFVSGSSYQHDGQPFQFLLRVEGRFILAIFFQVLFVFGAVPRIVVVHPEFFAYNDLSKVLDLFEGTASWEMTSDVLYGFIAD